MRQGNAGAKGSGSLERGILAPLSINYVDYTEKVMLDAKKDSS